MRSHIIGLFAIQQKELRLTVQACIYMGYADAAYIYSRMMARHALDFESAGLIYARDYRVA